MKKVFKYSLFSLMAAVSLLNGCGDGSTTSPLVLGPTVPGVGGGIYNPYTPVTSVPDQSTCLYYGGTWLGGSICKFSRSGVLFGSGSNFSGAPFYWLSLYTDYYHPMQVPLMDPANPGDTRGWSLGTLYAGNKVRYTGDLKRGRRDPWSADGCDDNTSTNLVVTDRGATYSLVVGVAQTILNTGDGFVGVNTNGEGDWYKGCAEANNNTPIAIFIDHCVNASGVTACP